jgi:undecaprenyl-diphosphatase
MHGAATRIWIFNVLKVASRLGDGWVWFGALLGVALAGGNTGASAAIRLFGVGATDLVLYRIIKRWIARPRPAGSGTGIIERVRPLDVFSFPSGHVMHAVACSVVLTAYYPMAAAVVWPLTILIALSRVILGLHYPSDVVAGAALGATVALMSFNLL